MIEFLQSLLHVDVLINQLATQLGVWLFVVLFLIIFAETGLVVMPFLPGDSLLFAVGAMAATSEHFPIQILIPLLCVASILGDSTNYLIGRKYGRRLFETEHRFSKFFNKKYLVQTEEFYIKRGRIAVAVSRFLPIFRTFAPFVAGITKMNYGVFVRFSILGSIAWINVFALAGYFFGRIPFIQKNFTFLVMGIVGFSLAPILLSILSNLIKKRS
jgi:membrane-associated protein